MIVHFSGFESLLALKVLNCIDPLNRGPLHHTFVLCQQTGSPARTRARERGLGGSALGAINRLLNLLAAAFELLRKGLLAQVFNLD